ncbi:hypothetical protein BH11BAC1_BH11BAC1_29820 [soil metagenome]
MSFQHYPDDSILVDLKYEQVLYYEASVDDRIITNSPDRFRLANDAEKKYYQSRQKKDGKFVDLPQWLIKN